MYIYISFVCHICLVLCGHPDTVNVLYLKPIMLLRLQRKRAEQQLTRH